MTMPLHQPKGLCQINLAQPFCINSQFTNDMRRQPMCRALSRQSRNQILFDIARSPRLNGVYAE
jgi:hypothetical protein